MDGRNNIPAAPTGTRITKNVWLCSDGVYRWSYEMDMLRNPVILITVWKVLGLSFGIVYLFTLFMDLIQGVVRSLEDLWNTSKVFLILIGVFFVIGIVAYLIVAASYGWKYQVLFEMTDEYVKHIQMPKQVKKAEAIGWLTAFAGLLSGKAYMVGLGLSASAKSTSTSEFSKVRKVKSRRIWHTIHVNHLLERNQIYAEKEDFDFVERFIKEHVPAKAGGNKQE